MRVKDKQIKSLLHKMEQQGSSRIGQPELLELLIAVADGSRRSPDQAKIDLSNPELSAEQRLAMATEGLSRKERSDVKALLATSEYEMTDEVRQTLSALIGESPPPVEEGALTRLAGQLAQDGQISAEDARALLDAAFGDGTLKQAETRELQAILERHRDKIDEPTRLQTEAFLGMTATDLQKSVHALTADGVIDVKDANTLTGMAWEDGQLSGAETATLRAVMLATRTSQGGQARLRASIDDFGEVGSLFLSEAEYGGGEIAGLPRVLREDPVFLLAVLRENGNYWDQLPQPLREDPDFILEAAHINGNVLRELPQPIEDEVLFRAAIESEGGAFECGSEALRNRRDLAEIAIKSNWYAVQALGPELRDDVGLGELAIAQDQRAFKELSEALRGNRELALQAVQAHGGMLEHVLGDLNQDPEIVRAAVTERGTALEFAHVDLQDDRELVTLAVQSAGAALEFASERLRDDEELYSAAMQKSPRVYRHGSERLRAKVEYARVALSKYGRELEHAPESIRGNRELVELALTQNARAIEFAAAELRDDQALVEPLLTRDPRVLQHLSERLRDNESLVRAAVDKSGQALQYASPRLKSKRRLVNAAISQTPLAYQYADEQLQKDRRVALHALHSCGTYQIIEPHPDLCADASFMREAIKIKPQLMAKAPESLRADRDFVAELVRRRPDVLFHATDELRQDRDYIESLILDVGAVYPYIHPDLHADRELLKLAMVDCPTAFEHAAEALRKDRELVEIAVRLDGNALISADPSFQQDRGLVLQAVSNESAVYWRLPTNMQRDLDVMATTLANHSGLIEGELSGLLGDPEVLVGMAEINPLALDHISQSLRDSVLRQHPDIKAEYRQLKADLKTLDIEFTDRLGDADMVQELIDNRTKPRDPEDTRPLALFVFPKQDWNNAFRQNSLKRMMEDYRVVYYEADSDEDLRKAMLESTADEKAAVMVIGGHGTQQRVSFGDGDPAYHDPTWRDEAGYLDLSDREQLQDAFAAAIAPQGHIVVKSCSTGAGRDREENIANFVASMAPQAHVHSPTVPTNNRIILNADGSFRSPGYRDGKAVTYTVEPTA